MASVFPIPGSYRVLLAPPVTHSESTIRSIFSQQGGFTVEITPEAYLFSYSPPDLVQNDENAPNQNPKTSAYVTILKSPYSPSHRSVILVRGNPIFSKPAIKIVETSFGLRSRIAHFDAIRLDAVIRKCLGIGKSLNSNATSALDSLSDAATRQSQASQIESLTFAIPNSGAAAKISRIRIRGDIPAVLDGSASLGGLRMQRLRLSAIQCKNWSIDTRGRMSVRKAADPQLLLEIIRELML